MSKITIILFFVALIYFSFQTPLTKLNLDNWQFKVQGHYDNRWFKANVPSNIYLDLIENKLIDDPFYRDNFQRNKWIHNTVIYYRAKFNETQIMRTLKIKQLIFQGLDTYANVTLNGLPLLLANNSYVKYTIPIKNLKPFEQNIIQIKFSPSPAIDNQGQTVQRLPFAYGWTRKPPYQYSWDWAPELISVGVWQPAYILSYQSVRIDYVWFRDKVITSNEAIINIAVVLKRQQGVNPMAAIPSDINIYVEGKPVGNITIKQRIGYRDVVIHSPKLWWPHNIGTPFIYNFTIQLKRNNQVIQTRKYVHGIRTIQLNTTNGAFQFIVNGYPVYAKGANYVPPDMFYPRFTNSFYNSDYPLKNYMETIVQSNYNMIRVWGGGQYESDAFYQQCSRRGIMIFQDFMFSVNIYPGTESFLRNCEEEVKQQIRRIRNYPALALWSGNNQILQGINDWGWGSPEYKKNYDLLFEKLIRKILEIQSPDISYIPSSPQFGSGSNTQVGDIHSWRVWAGASQFESYQRDVARFNSQFGTQAFPVWETVKYFTEPEDRSYESPILLKHERHGSQFNIFKKYISEHMNPSISFQMQVFQSGIVQAYAVQLAIAAQRSGKPQTWGTLYWQFNDAWPGISWSSMDFFGRWKPLQYFAKRLYSDIAIFFVNNPFKGNQLQVRIVNDKLLGVDAVLNLRICDFNGNNLYNKSQKLSLKPNEVRNYLIIQQNEKVNYLKTTPQDSVVVYGQIIAGKDNIMRNTYFFKKYKQLKLIPATLKVSYNANSNYITLQSDKFIKNLYISHADQYIKLSDNYFDMIPHHPVQVHLDNGSLAQLKSRLIYRTLLDTYNKAASLIVSVI